MNYKAIAIGAALAALAAALHALTVLPAPWGAVATAVAVLVASASKGWNQ